MTEARAVSDAMRFYGDMTQEEAWEWLARNARTAIAQEFQQLHRQGASHRSSPATKRHVTDEMLSLFLAGADERSPTLDTLVKLAWGFNRYVEINFVSHVPSQEVLYPAEAPAGHWPTPLAAAVTGSAFIKPKGVPVMKSHEIKLEAPVDQFYQPTIDTRFSAEFLPPMPAHPGQQNSPLSLKIELVVLTDIKDGGNAGKLLMRGRTTLKIAYDVDAKTPRKELDGLADFARKESIRHVWPFYGDILKTAAVRTGLPLSVIRLVQKHLGEFIEGA